MTDDFKQTAGTDSSLDTDRAFMLVEITADKFYFQTISRVGKTVDSGTFVRQALPSAAASAH